MIPSEGIACPTIQPTAASRTATPSTSMNRMEPDMGLSVSDQRSRAAQGSREVGVSAEAVAQHLEARRSLILSISAGVRKVAGNDEPASCLSMSMAILGSSFHDDQREGEQEIAPMGWHQEADMDRKKCSVLLPTFRVQAKCSVRRTPRVRSISNCIRVQKEIAAWGPDDGEPDTPSDNDSPGSAGEGSPLAAPVRNRVEARGHKARTAAAQTLAKG